MSRPVAVGVSREFIDRRTAAVAAVQNALAFSGAVFGPPIFALIASAASYRAAVFAVAVCVVAVGAWQLVTARRMQAVA